MINNQHLKLFVGDRPPGFDVFPDFEYASHQNGKGFELVKFHDLDEIASIFSGEYYWLFSLRRTLYGMGNLPEIITIAHPRRFVLNAPFGRDFENTNHYKFLTSDDIREMNHLALMTPNAGCRWLIGQPFFFGNGDSVLDDGHASHCVDDLLRFSVAAIDFGLSSDVVFNLLKSKFVFPSPSVGTFEVKPFLRILDILENVAFKFFRDGVVRSAGRRPGRLGFLLTRLHGFLLTAHLEEIGVLNDSEIFGYQTIHSESNVCDTC